MEYFDLYDRHGNKLNKLMARGTTNNPGEYHKVVHIWIKNSKKEYLVQQRNKPTDDIPYQWAPTAGACITGESPIESAIRETFEEIGVKLQKSDLIFKDSIYRDHPRGNYCIELYLVKKDVDIKDIVMDKEEVKNVAYYTKEEIYQMIDANTFWDFRDHKNYFDILEKS